MLSVPPGVSRASNSAATFKPYDPADTLGDTSPTTPKPQKDKHGCGGIGQIILSVVSLAITAFLPPVGGILGGIVQAAGINLATQGVGVALGIQDRINWGSVGISALTAGIGGGQTGNFLVDLGVNAAANAAVQGIAVATGLQSHFDWAGVAAAGLGAAVGGQIGKAFVAAPAGSIGAFSQRLAYAGANAITNASTRSLIDGTDFGDNLVAALPTVIGQTVGGWLIDTIANGGGRTSIAKKQLSFDKNGPSGGIDGSISIGDYDDVTEVSPASVDKLIGGDIKSAMASGGLTTGGSVSGQVPYVVVPAIPWSSGLLNGAVTAKNGDWIVTGFRPNLTKKFNFIVAKNTPDPRFYGVRWMPTWGELRETGRIFWRGGTEFVEGLNNSLAGTHALVDAADYYVFGKFYDVTGLRSPADQARHRANAEALLGHIKDRGIAGLAVDAAHGAADGVDNFLVKDHLTPVGAFIGDSLTGAITPKLGGLSVDARTALRSTSKLFDRVAAERFTLTASTLDDATIARVVGIEKGARPSPGSYLSPEYIEAHASLFEGGAARIQPSAPTGTIGRTETWVMPLDTAQSAIANAGGNVRALEQALGLDAGYLGANPVLVEIPKPTGYRIPTGNEFGANQFWRPGGFTSGGLPEAVIDPVRPGAYTVRPAFRR